MATTLHTQRQWLVTVSVAGVPLGIFDQHSGGQKDSEESKYSPGGMQPEIAGGGQSSYDNVVVSRHFSTARDAPLLPWLDALVGKADMAVAVQALDEMGAAIPGAAFTYTGKLKRVTPPESNSTESGESRIELEQTTVGMA